MEFNNFQNRYKPALREVYPLTKDWHFVAREFNLMFDSILTEDINSRIKCLFTCSSYALLCRFMSNLNGL